MDSPAEARSTVIAWALLLILIVVGTGTVLMFLQNYGPGSMMLSTACLCLTLLARDPSNRYPSASEAIEDLERFLTRHKRETFASRGSSCPDTRRRDRPEHARSRKRVVNSHFSPMQ